MTKGQNNLRRHTNPLTLKDVIETFVTYDLRHSVFPHNLISEEYGIPYLFGMAIDNRKIILIDEDLGQEETRATLIHELLHTKHYRLGDLSERLVEKTVRAETKRMYKLLYGVDMYSYLKDSRTKNT